MRVEFEMSIPMGNMQDKSPTAMVSIVAEVVNPCLPNEIVFIKTVTGNGMAILWNMHGSSDLYVQAQTLASHHASEELNRIDKLINTPGVSVNTGDHVVNIAEEVLAHD